MSDNKEEPSFMYRTPTVTPDPCNEIEMATTQLYPSLPVPESVEHLRNNEHHDVNGPSRSSPLPRRLPRLPKVNVNIPQMININAYIPTVKPPAFFKEVYTIPVQMGDQLNKEMHKMGNNINKLIDRSEVYLRKPPPMPEFNNCSLLSTLFSIANYIFDLGSDIAVAYVLWDEPDSVWWFWLTVALIVVPTIFVNGFSLYWYWHDDHECASKAMFAKRPRISKCWWIFRIIMHILLIGPLVRNIDILYYGVKSRKSRLQRVDIQGPYCPWPKQRKELKKQAEYYNLLLHEERDISLLELMHSFLQDAPQLILQLYILAKRPPESKGESDYIITILVQLFSLMTSLCSLSWSLTSYQRALRYAMPEKPNLSVGASASIFLWHTFTVAARVVSLALFATSFKLEVFILLVAHWVVMTSWILGQKTNFCGTEDGKKRPCEEFLYNIVMGWVFAFVMINVKDSPTRIKYAVYYLLMLAENTVMIVLWFLVPENSTHWYHYPALIGTMISFIIGLIFMLIYYRKYHPDGKMPKKNAAAKFL